MNDDRTHPIQANLPSARVRFGPYLADLRSQELWKHGVRLKLTGQPMQILAMLLAVPGELVTRESIQRRLWPGDVFVDANHGLNAAVNKLRDTLCDTAERPRYIETLPRRGYRFIGEVEWERDAPALSAPVMETPVVAPADALVARQDVVMAAAYAVASERSRRWGMPMVAAAAVLLGIGISVGVLLNQPPQEQRAAAVEPGEADQREVSQKEAAETNAVGRGMTPPSPPLAESRKKEAEAGRENGTARLRTVVAGDSGNAAPQISPDGKRLAFMSDRTGAWQIWVSNVDGGAPRQVSFTESAGTPRWSPDGRSLVFDAPGEDGTHIFVAGMEREGAVRQLVAGLVPSYSRDGKWIYYASDRTGDWQVWKVPVSGGAGVQVTRDGGFAALESGDGYVYYSKSRYPQPEICRVPAAGGRETCMTHLRPRTWASWSVTRAGIVFAEDLPNGQAGLSLYDPSRRQLRDLVALRSAPFWVGASADGSRVMVNDAREREISMVECLR